MKHRILSACRHVGMSAWCDPTSYIADKHAWHTYGVGMSACFYNNRIYGYMVLHKQHIFSVNNKMKKNVFFSGRCPLLSYPILGYKRYTPWSGCQVVCRFWPIAIYCRLTHMTYIYGYEHVGMFPPPFSRMFWPHEFCQRIIDSLKPNPFCRKNI